MKKQQTITSLWALLFALQMSMAVALVVGLTKQPARSAESTGQTFAPSKAYGKVLTDGVQLTADEQRRLVGLCQDLEGMLQTHVRLETSMLSEARHLFIYMLVFVGATLILQVILVWVSRRSDAA